MLVCFLYIYIYTLLGTSILYLFYCHHLHFCSICIVAHVSLLLAMFCCLQCTTPLHTANICVTFVSGATHQFPRLAVHLVLLNIYFPQTDDKHTILIAVKHYKNLMLILRYLLSKLSFEFL